MRKGQCSPSPSSRPAPGAVTQVKTKARTDTNPSRSASAPAAARTSPAPKWPHHPQGRPQARGAQESFRSAAQGNQVFPRNLREVPWDGKEDVKVGTSSMSHLRELQEGDVIGTSKGRGFMGVVRRWGFHGLPPPMASPTANAPPAPWVASTQSPRASIPAKKMPDTGASNKSPAATSTSSRSRRTRTGFFVQGAVPGPTGGLVLVKGGSDLERREPSPVVSKVRPRPRPIKMQYRRAPRRVLCRFD